MSDDFTVSGQYTQSAMVEQLLRELTKAREERDRFRTFVFYILHALGPDIEISLGAQSAYKADDRLFITKEQASGILRISLYEPRTFN